MNAEDFRTEAIKMAPDDAERASPVARVHLWHYGLPLAILVACVGLLALALVQLSEIAKTMRVDAPGNMLWVISQAEVEALRTQNALTMARLEDWDDASRQTVGLRYDLLLSRLTLLSEGPQQRTLAELGIAATVQELSGKVKQLDPAQQPLTDRTSVELAQVLTELHRVLNRSANRQMVIGWESLSAQLERYRQTVSQVIASVLGVILGAMLLGWQIISGKQALLRAEESRLRAIKLEQELKGVRATASYYRDFASVVSHQFRTPLAIIDSAAQRLISGGKAADMPVLKERRAVIRQTVDRLARLVDAALMAGRLDHGIVEFHAAEYDFVALARGVRDDFARIMPERDIRINAPDTPILVNCDPSLVTHIIMNLLDNALKYSPPDQPIAFGFETSGTQIGCTIADGGSGVSDADLPHIFDRFRRGQHRTDAQGSGIGLWIARRLAELQGGALTVSNRIAGGAAFTVWLPAAAPAPEPEEMRP